MIRTDFIKEMTSSELAKLLCQDMAVFYLPYCEDKEDLELHYTLRKVILETLLENLEQEYHKMKGND